MKEIRLSENSGKTVDGEKIVRIIRDKIHKGNDLLTECPSFSEYNRDNSIAKFIRKKDNNTNSHSSLKEISELETDLNKLSLK